MFLMLMFNVCRWASQFPVQETPGCDLENNNEQAPVNQPTVGVIDVFGCPTTVCGGGLPLSEINIPQALSG